jgi:hypothetical protein
MKKDKLRLFVWTNFSLLQSGQDRIESATFDREEGWAIMICLKLSMV